MDIHLFDLVACIGAVHRNLLRHRLLLLHEGSLLLPNHFTHFSGSMNAGLARFRSVTGVAHEQQRENGKQQERWPNATPTTGGRMRQPSPSGQNNECHPANNDKEHRP